MRLRVSQAVSILCDEMGELSNEGVNFELGERPRWDHTPFADGSIQSLTEEWRAWLAEFQEWGQPRGKRGWLLEQRMEA